MALTRWMTTTALVGALLCGTASAQSTRLSELSHRGRESKARRDLRRLKSYVLAKNRLQRALQQAAPILGKSGEDLLSPDERRRLLDLFAQVVEYSVGLESIAKYHMDFVKLSPTKELRQHARHFLLAYAAMLLHLDLALGFVDSTLGKPHFERLLDEADPVTGLPAGTFARLKYSAVHVEDASLAVALHQVHKALGQTAYPRLDNDRLLFYCGNIVDITYPKVRGRLMKHGARMFMGNGIDIVVDKGYSTWFPVQAEVAEWLGDTKVVRPDAFLIQPDQIEAAVKRTRPGDILFERRNWYLSNVGLPGFWPHAALYLGSPAELAAYFDDDDQVTAAFGQPFSRYLKSQHPTAWASYDSTDEAGHAFRVIEAMSEGVLFTTAEHSLHCDYAAAVRPKLSKVDIARAIDRAFGYHFRPYDFDFDFYTDTSLVCSEVVYKAYEPSPALAGLRFDLEDMLGRKTLAPNTMVRLFDRQLGTEQEQMSFVWFLDGFEHDRRAQFADVNAFRRTHERIKWDIAQR